MHHRQPNRQHSRQLTRQLSREELNAIREMAHTGQDWAAVQRYVQLPLADLKRHIRLTLPPCSVLLDEAENKDGASQQSA